MSKDDRCFGCGWTGQFGCHCHNVQCYGCDEFGRFAQDCPNKIPPSGTPHHLFKASIYPHPKGQITLHLLWSHTWETIHPTAIPTMTGVAVSESTHHAPHPAIAALQPMDAPITTHAMTHPTSIVASHPAFATSPTDITLATIPKTRASLAPATPTALHRNTAKESQATPKTFNPPKIPPFQDCHHPGLPARFFLRFVQQLRSSKLLEPPPSSDEDEQGWQSSSTHSIIGLASDCPTVTVQAEKHLRFWLTLEQLSH